MATVRINFKGHSELAAEADAKASLKHRAKHAPGPDIEWCRCGCGLFGPWTRDGVRYCATHVPPDTRYAAQHFAETMEE